MKDIYYRTAENFADLLDNRFKIFGIRFGLDPIINLIPWFGDVIGAVFGLYLIYIADKLGLSRNDKRKMLINLGLDFLIGLIPFLGVIGDIAFKSNMRNWNIIKNHVNKFERSGEVEEGEIVG